MIEDVKFYYKKNNILNINDLYDINIDEKVYCLKEINPHLLDPFGTICDFDEETFFDKKTDIEIEYVMNINNFLLI